MSSALKVRIAWARVSSQERAKVGNVEICVSRNLRAVWTYGLQCNHANHKSQVTKENLLLPSSSAHCLASY